MMPKKIYNNILQMAYDNTFLIYIIQSIIYSELSKGYELEVQGYNIHIFIWKYEV